MTEAVAGALEPNLQAAEIRRATAKPTGSLAAYDLYLRALRRAVERGERQKTADSQDGCRTKRGRESAGS